MDIQKVGFRYGVLWSSLEEQSKEQGFTLGEKAKELEDYRQAAITLRFGVDLPDSIYEKLLQRINKRVIKALKVVPQKNNGDKGD